MKIKMLPISRHTSPVFRDHNVPMINAEYNGGNPRLAEELSIVEFNNSLSFQIPRSTIRAIQRSWFARVNALCNFSRKKSREVAAHFRADF